MIGHGVPVYRGYASQYGHGFGNVLGGLVRSALPIVGKIAKSASHGRATAQNASSSHFATKAT